MKFKTKEKYIQKVKLKEKVLTFWVLFYNEFGSSKHHRIENTREKNKCNRRGDENN